MPKYEIVFNVRFEIEFEQIINDIIDDYSDDYADKISISLKEKVKLLKTQPKMYPIYIDIPLYRKFLVDDKFIVFYTVDDKNKIIELAHIIAAVRDITNLLY